MITIFQTQEFSLGDEVLSLKQAAGCSSLPVLKMAMYCAFENDCSMLYEICLKEKQARSLISCDSLK